MVNDGGLPGVTPAGLLHHSSLRMPISTAYSALYAIDLVNEVFMPTFRREQELDFTEQCQLSPLSSPLGLLLHILPSCGFGNFEHLNVLKNTLALSARAESC